MNITVLHKLEKGWIDLDWKGYIHRANLTIKDWEGILDKIENFKSNRSAKQIILFRYKGLPAYVTIKREEYSQLLQFMLQKFIDLERYDLCQRISEMQKKYLVK